MKCNSLKLLVIWTIFLGAPPVYADSHASTETKNGSVNEPASSTESERLRIQRLENERIRRYCTELPFSKIELNHLSIDTRFTTGENSMRSHVDAPVISLPESVPPIIRDALSFTQLSVVHRRGNELEFEGHTYKGRPIDYYHPHANEPSTTVETAYMVLRKIYGRKILGKRLGRGGFRVVFEHGLDKNKVIKIYSIPTRTWRKPEAVERLPLSVAVALQRDLVMEQILVNEGFRVARIDVNHEHFELFLKFGILIQDRVDPFAKSFYKYYRNELNENVNLSRLPELSSFAERIRSLRDRLHEKYYNEVSSAAVLGEYADLPFMRLSIVSPFLPRKGELGGSENPTFHSHLSEFGPQDIFKSRLLSLIDYGPENLMIDDAEKEPIFVDY